MTQSPDIHIPNTASSKSRIKYIIPHSSEYLYEHDHRSCRFDDLRIGLLKKLTVLVGFGTRIHTKTHMGVIQLNAAMSSQNKRVMQSRPDTCYLLTLAIFARLLRERYLWQARLAFFKEFVNAFRNCGLIKQDFGSPFLFINSQFFSRIAECLKEQLF